MFPKEHGAYGQLLFPIGTAFAVGGISWSAAALAAAAVCAFLAHEPLLVLIGQRGPRARRELRARAWRWFGATAGAGALFAAAALVTLPPAARLALAVTIALSVGLAAFIAVKREHTALGESWMSATMGSLAAPIAIASASSLQTAITLAGAFAAAFIAPTVAVHAVIASTRRPPATGLRLGSLAVTVLLVAGVWLAAVRGVIAWPGVWAVVPAAGAAAALALAPPSARQLRVVGWTLVGTSTAAAAILIAGLAHL
jgi:YwiC-like protein